MAGLFDSLNERLKSAGAGILSTVATEAKSAINTTIDVVTNQPVNTTPRPAEISNPPFDPTNGAIAVNKSVSTVLIVAAVILGVYLWKRS